MKKIISLLLVLLLALTSAVAVNAGSRSGEQHPPTAFGVYISIQA